MTSHPPTPRRAEAQRMPRIIETGGGQKEDESEQAGGGVTWTICIFKFEFFFSAPVAPQIFHTLSAFSPAICLSLSEDWALALPDGSVFSVLFLSSSPLVLCLSLILSVYFFFFLSHFFTVSISLCTVYLFFWSIHFSALYLFTSESTEKGFTSSLFIYTYTYTFTYSILGLSVFSSIFFLFFSSTLFLFCLSV